ncbi:TPA: hypothetical protein R4142_005124 [Citrobacter freundii]|jgi:hypothetical protein|uniref:Uncharacterized protein n=13 Tax=Enterobacteriaceae TaxID=543 RepID=A0AAN4F205_CITFR|nr:hypothetical protein [Citrobacter freundii]EKW2112440.1 hypothetical protein [Citrobacter freundii]ELK7555893.1 hypothetical protein [Citrobacter freundii]HED3529131.1 hypothetical protein [Citrobacter freundii]
MIIFTSLAYFNFLSANKTSCQAYRNTAPKENIFSKIITEGSESKIGRWKEMENVYDIFFNDQLYMISETPKDYLSSAIRIILSKDYDQSQKVYTIILMQNLPIKEYMCFMDAVNEQFEKGLIDKEVARFAILPDINLYSTSIYYWWLPDWRERFKKNANSLFKQKLIDDVLSGRYFFYALRK